ncbi:hypothetical protein F4803DRAFT_519765 [Xylaria telfairii]|nr:hypothetical protein F4803DRAFT_519765 [Xylaria telfairii]
MCRMASLVVLLCECKRCSNAHSIDPEHKKYYPQKMPAPVLSLIRMGTMSLARTGSASSAWRRSGLMPTVMRKESGSVRSASRSV